MKKTKYLSTDISKVIRYIITKIGNKYDMAKSKDFLIYEMSFFLSGIIGSNILLNIILKNNPTTYPEKVIIAAIIICWFGISYNVISIIGLFIRIVKSLINKS